MLTQECHAKRKFRSPNLKVMSKLKQFKLMWNLDIDDCLKDHYCYNEYYENGDSYEDVREAFIEEAISVTIPK